MNGAGWNLAKASDEKQYFFLALPWKAKPQNANLESVEICTCMVFSRTMSIILPNYQLGLEPIDYPALSTSVNNADMYTHYVVLQSY